jgi:hypothetical protein
MIWARNRGDETRENCLREELYTLWDKMTQAEHDVINKWIREGMPNPQYQGNKPNKES